MTEQQNIVRNKATIRSWGDRVWNQGDFSATPDLIADDFVCHRPGGMGDLRGRAAHDRWVAEARERNPSLRVEILNLIAEGDTVASYWRGTGVGMHFYRMVHGRIAEMWTVVTEQEI